MAGIILTNFGDFEGTFLGDDNAVATTNSVETTIYEGMTATKAADKSTWLSGPLTYTITLDNQSEADFEDVTFTDILDPELIALDENFGIFIGNVKTTNYTYTAADGTLTVPVGSIAIGSDITIMFRVLQK